MKVEIIASLDKQISFTSFKQIANIFEVVIDLFLGHYF